MFTELNVLYVYIEPTDGDIKRQGVEVCRDLLRVLV